jgi:uroporphyrinogen decarboxylase
MMKCKRNIPWQPAIYEHKAALIGRSPYEVSRSVKLLVEAMQREFDVYGSNYMTVGLDVYNVEAEALGAKVIMPGRNACPDLESALFDLNSLPGDFRHPEIPRAGRFELLLEAGCRIKEALGGQVRVRVAASGPVTLAVKLSSVEDVILSLCVEDGLALRLLNFAAEIAERWIRCLRDHNLEAIIFDSMAAPPMLSPTLYECYAMPMHQRLMRVLQASGQRERELVIGGNTTPIAGLLAQTGATILLCDYAADARAFKAALGDDHSCVIRRNLAPTALCCADPIELVKQFAADLALFSRPMAGTGVLPYDFDPECLLTLRDRLAAHIQCQLAQEDDRRPQSYM